MPIFRLFEKSLATTSLQEATEPPPGLVAFYWHFARQAKGLFIGAVRRRLCGRAARRHHPGVHRQGGHAGHQQQAGRAAGRTPGRCSPAWPLVLLVARPAASTIQHLLMNQAIAANVSNRIRWQNHWHVVRQSWAFFQNDFAGRIATRVMQTGPAIRESLVALLTAVWFILIYGTSSLILLASRRPLAGGAGAAVVRRLHRDAALLRAAHARPLEGRCRKRARC